MATGLEENIADLATPALLVDKKIFERNCQRMLDVSQKHGVKLRGHIKSHKTREGAVIQTGGTCSRVVCSTIPEVEMLVPGFDDIVFGVVLCPSKLGRLHELKEKIPKFHVFIDNPTTLASVERFYDLQKGKKWSVFLKVNTGANRAGIPWNQQDELLSLASRIAFGPATTLFGLYTHDGSQSYGKDRGEVEAIAKRSVEKLKEIVGVLQEHGIENLEYGIGCTPTCSNPVEEIEGLTEIHPGNYVFYDAQQYSYGNCGLEDIAVSVLTRVIGQYPERDEFIIDAGFTATTKQGADALKSGNVIFKGHPELRLRQQTQEIGIVCAADGENINISDYPVGKILELYPYHSCATAAQFGSYTIRIDDKVVDRWVPAKYW